MIRSSLLPIAAVVAVCAALPHAAHAQFPVAPGNPVSFGVTGGLAVPTGRLSDGVNAGYTVGGLLDFHPAPGPLSLRVEAGYDRFETKQSLLDDVANQVGADVTANTHFTRFTGNLVLRIPMSGGLRPYLTGGAGVYSIGGGTTYSSNGTTFTSNDRSQTKFGINGGVGLELPLSGIAVFVEARAHGVQTDATPITYVPITVGIRF